MSVEPAHAPRHRPGAAVGVAAREAIEQSLDELRDRVADVVGAVVASVDGLPMAHNLRHGEPSSIAAMAATAAGLGRRIVADCELGGFTEAVVRGEQGYLAIYGAGPIGVLAAVASHGANLGRVHLHARGCAAAVAAALAGAAP